MASAFSCDGCGEGVAKPKRIGFVIVRDYCEACAKHANTFLDDEEAMRASLVGAFVSQRELLIQQFGANSFRLPDVPDAQ